MRLAERWAADARATLEGSPEDCRRGFEALLGGRRMVVYADVARGFRVEGLFAVPWMQEAPQEPSDSLGGITGSGGPIRPSADNASRGAASRDVGGVIAPMPDW